MGGQGINSHHLPGKWGLRIEQKRVGGSSESCVFSPKAKLGFGVQGAEESLWRGVGLFGALWSMCCAGDAEPGLSISASPPAWVLEPGRWWSLFQDVNRFMVYFAVCLNAVLLFGAA